jgi:hypothetical protein
MDSDTGAVFGVLFLFWIGAVILWGLSQLVHRLKYGRSPEHSAELYLKSQHAQIEIATTRERLALEREHQREQMRMMRDEVPGSVPPAPVAAAPPEPPAAPAQPSGRLNADRL